MKDLTLNLINNWFKMIFSGQKNVEYRDITPLYCSKFLLYKNDHETPQWWFDCYFNSITDECLIDDLIEDILLEHTTFKKFKSVKFVNGMRKIMPRMKLEFKQIEIGEGEKELGAVDGVFYFKIHLGQLLESENINLLK
jgi:hypothetical protein